MDSGTTTGFSVILTRFNMELKGFQITVTAKPCRCPMGGHWTYHAILDGTDYRGVGASAIEALMHLMFQVYNHGEVVLETLAEICRAADWRMGACFEGESPQGFALGGERFLDTVGDAVEGFAHEDEWLEDEDDGQFIN